MYPIGEMAVFIEVVEQGSFSAAARRLGLASSVVADRVKGLERRLGVRLLARTTRRQSLTEAGATYLQEARAILAAVTSLETRLSEESSTPSGALKVTAPAPVGRRWIAPFIGDFVRRYPAVRVHLTLEDRYADIVGRGSTSQSEVGRSSIPPSLAGACSRRVVSWWPVRIILRGMGHQGVLTTSRAMSVSSLTPNGISMPNGVSAAATAPEIFA